MMTNMTEEGVGRGYCAWYTCRSCVALRRNNKTELKQREWARLAPADTDENNRTFSGAQHTDVSSIVCTKLN